MKTNFATLTLVASLAMASASAQAANVSVEGDGNNVTVVENHYHIRNEYNVRRDYDDRAYYPRSYGPRYDGYYARPHMIVRPMLYFFRFGMRGFYR